LEEKNIMASDNESAYKIMIDKNEFSTPTRKSRTKELLSGGAGLPRTNEANTNIMHQLNNHNFMPRPTDQQDIGVNQNRHESQKTADQQQSNMPQFQQSVDQQKYNWPQFQQPVDQQQHDRPQFQSNNTMPPIDCVGDPRNPNEYNAFWEKSGSESSRSPVVNRGRRRPGKYGISDSDSGSNDFQTDRQLNRVQKKIVLDTIREHCPDTMHSMVYEDVIAQMEQLEKQGFKLPENYDTRRNTIDTNEIRLYEQQVKRDKHRDLKKMAYMLNFAALGLNGFCQCMSFDWIKTKQLPKMIREGIQEGDFDDCLEGIGVYLRGTIFDNPVFSTVLKFVEKVGEAHQADLEAEQEHLEEEEDRRIYRNTTALRTMNKFRGQSSTFSGDATSGDDSSMPFDTPLPKSTFQSHTHTKKTLSN
jgi:hypothetical protein